MAGRCRMRSIKVWMRLAREKSGGRYNSWLFCCDSESFLWVFGGLIGRIKLLYNNCICRLWSYRSWFWLIMKLNCWKKILEIYLCCLCWMSATINLPVFLPLLGSMLFDPLYYLSDSSIIDFSAMDERFEQCYIRSALCLTGCTRWNYWMSPLIW